MKEKDVKNENLYEKIVEKDTNECNNLITLFKRNKHAK